MYGAAILGESTADAAYASVLANAFTSLDQTQNRSPDLIGRGDFWATWTVHNAAATKDSGRPPQFTDQTRPLAPATVMAYGPRCLWTMAQQRQLVIPRPD